MTASLKTIYQLTNRKVFPVNCQYLLAYFDKKDPVATGPNDYTEYDWDRETATWLKRANFCSPFQNSTLLPYSCRKSAKPRQGLNTGGANDLFFFDTVAKSTPTTMIVANKKHQIELPKKYLYPLLASSNFKENDLTPHKWVLMLYHDNGKIITSEEMQAEPLLTNYLNQYQLQLKTRKGLFLRNYIKKDFFYALLGVGPYSFAPYKIIWQAMGAKQFKPKIFTGNWQANQAMHSFIPLETKAEAEAICRYLATPSIKEYVEKRYGVGHQSFAQPHIIKELFRWV